MEAREGHGESYRTSNGCPQAGQMDASVSPGCE
jgi:hypothetical protein